MRICGIELSSSEALLAGVELLDGNITSIPMETRRIKLKVDERAEQVKSFYNAFNSFLRGNKIDIVAIKKRAKKGVPGVRPGGAVSFKIEALIQLCNEAQVILLSPQTIAAAKKREAFDIPKELFKYQEQAYLTACCYAMKAK